MVYNTLDVLGAALQLGVPIGQSAGILAKVPHVKGRVEVVPTPGKDYTVLIDYAHSPDSLTNVLSSVRGFAKGRPLPCLAAAVTGIKRNGPRWGGQPPGPQIFWWLQRIIRGQNGLAISLPTSCRVLRGATRPYVVVEDRVEAIHYCLDHALTGDVIVLCGKGHETYQEIDHVKHHMDEREIVAEYLKAQT